MRSAFERSAISRLHCSMFASLKSDPDKSASKKEAVKRFAFLKLAPRTTLCWKATPLRFSPSHCVLSRLTPRVIVIRRPLCSVEAPPPWILTARVTGQQMLIRRTVHQAEGGANKGRLTLALLRLRVSDERCRSQGYAEQGTGDHALRWRLRKAHKNSMCVSSSMTATLCCVCARSVRSGKMTEETPGI